MLYYILILHYPRNSAMACTVFACVCVYSRIKYINAHMCVPPYSDSGTNNNNKHEIGMRIHGPFATDSHVNRKRKTRKTFIYSFLPVGHHRLHFRSANTEFVNAPVAKGTE